MATIKDRTAEGLREIIASPPKASGFKDEAEKTKWLSKIYEDLHEAIEKMKEEGSI